jgi:hypothetical protein
MIAVYERFPELCIHDRELFTTKLSSKQLQQKLILAIRRINGKTFTFEEMGNPSLPACTVLFEFGIAEANNFSYIDEEEAKKVQAYLKKQAFKIMDFLCAIRYYKDYSSNKKPLRFDYYLTRFIFNECMMELQIFHERGPRHISPRDIVTFLSNRINESSPRKFLKQTEPQNDTN